MQSERTKWLLGIETSERAGSLGLCSPLGEAIGWDLPRESGSAATLVKGIEAFLRAQSIEREELGAVAVNCGPGSFTGIRVGIATGKSLAFGLKIPAISVDTLESIFEVWQATTRDVSEISHVTVIVNAYRGQLFVRDWTRGVEQSHWIPTSPSRLVDEATWLPTLEALDPKATRLVGPEVDRLLNRLPDDWALARHAVSPHGEAVAKLGNRRWELGDTLDPWSLMPNYLRRSAAEEQS